MGITGRRRAVAAAALAAAAVTLPGGASADGPSFTVADVVVGESGQATFTIRLAAPAEVAESFTWSTADVTAAAGADYETASDTATVAGGATETTFDVAVAADALDEVDERFAVTVKHSSGLPEASAAATITDDDAPPAVSVGPPAAEVEEGGVASFPVTLSAASGRPVQVGYQTIPATSQDFTGTANGAVVIPAGAVAGAIEIQTTEDAVIEGDESFTVALNPCDATCVAGAQTQATATIADDEAAPTISVEPAAVEEPDAGTVELAFTVRLSAATGTGVRVVALTADGTAAAPLDYQQKSQPLAFAPGETEKQFVVLVNGDVLDEPHETFSVRLVEPEGAELGTAEATGTITDADASSLLAVSDASVDEGSSGTTSLAFTVSLTPASARTVTVAYATADATATAGSDYTTAAGTLTFAPGGGPQTVSVQVLGDTIVEENEVLRLELRDVTGAVLADAEGIGTIVDRNAPPTLTVSDAIGREGQGASFTVELMGTTLRTVSVGVTTSDGSARAGADYLARATTLTFAPGERMKTVAVTILDDAATEPAETFSVGLGNAVNASIAKSRGTATIEASDPAAAPPATGPTTPPTQPGAPPKRPLPRMTLAPRTVVVTHAGVAPMRIACAKASPVACAGRVVLETAARPAVRLGAKAFSARRGKSVGVPIKLTPRGLRLLGQRGTLRARAIVLVRTGGSTLRVVPGFVLLKAPPKASAATR